MLQGKASLGRCLLGQEKANAESQGENELGKERRRFVQLSYGEEDSGAQ